MLLKAVVVLLMASLGQAIIRGNLTSISKFKYAVHIGYLSFTGDADYQCTGALVALNWVLTVAHPFQAPLPVRPAAIRMIAGDSCTYEWDVKFQKPPPSAQVRYGKRYVGHPAYVTNIAIDEAWFFDIALIEPKQPFKSSLTVNTIPLSNYKWLYSTKPRTKCRLAGFGQSVPDLTIAQIQLGVKLAPNAIHQIDKLSVRKGMSCTPCPKFKSELMRHLACAKLENITYCPGDHGAVLECDGLAAAIATPVRMCEKAETGVVSDVKCAVNGTSVNVFIDVCPHLPWIALYVRGVHDACTKDSAQPAGNKKKFRTMRKASSSDAPATCQFTPFLLAFAGFITLVSILLIRPKQHIEM